MTWIQTFSGKKFSLVDPQPEDVDIVDIISALGNLCRFNGHCRKFYSVLQHSVRVAELCGEDQRYDGLMHDAGEAYYGDITRPMKVLWNEATFGRFSEWYKRIDAVVAEALKISNPLPREVRHFDNVMLAAKRGHYGSASGTLGDVTRSDQGRNLRVDSAGIILPICTALSRVETMNARTTDPITSHEAAQQHEASGRSESNRATLLAAVRRIQERLPRNWPCSPALNGMRRAGAWRTSKRSARFITASGANVQPMGIS